MRRLPLVVLGFIALGLLGLELAYRETQASPVWLAAGLAIAALARWGIRMWPGVWIGEFLVVWLGPAVIAWLDGHAATRAPLGPLAAALIASGSAAGAVAATWLLRRLGVPAWSATRDLPALILAASAYGLISGAIGSCVLAAGGAPFLPVFATWATGDLIGAVIIAPALLLQERGGLRRALRPEAVGIAAALALCIGATVLVPSDELRSTISYLPLAPLVWAALRLPATLSSTLLAAWAAAMVAATVAGKGPFTSPGTSLPQVLGFQGYLLAGAAVVHLISLSQRRQDLDRRELQRSEEQFRLVTQHSHDLICLHDPDGTFRWVSPSVAEILGWRPEDLLGRSPYEFIHADDAPRIRDGSHAQVLAGGGGELVEYRFHRADGGWTWLETTTEPVSGPDGLPIRLQTVSRDVGQRRSQLERLRLATGAARMAVYELDLRDGTLIADERLALHLGLDLRRSASPRADWTALIHPDDQEAMARTFATALTDGAYESLYRIRTPQGQERWIHAQGIIERENGQPARLIGVNMDVTERERSQRALADARLGLALNEERLRLALESSGTGLWDWSTTEDHAYFSPTWMTMLGYRPDEFPGSGATWRMLIHPDDLPKALDALTDHLAGRTPAYRSEFRMRQKDGTWAWILSSGQAVSAGAGERPTRVIGTHVDITALKRAEVARAAEARRAEEAMRAKGDFLATMSHEIRTPMNGVIGMVSVLEGTELSAEQRDMVGTIRSSGEVLLNVLNDILDLSKIEAGRLDLELTDVAVRSAVADIANLFRGQADAKGLAFEVVVEGDPWARADPHRLRQVLVNLLSNAIKFTPAGRVRIHAAVVGDRCRIAIHDTGIGIPAELLHRLFQPFTQVDSSTTRRFGGTGLGLAISRRLTDAMGGTIAVDGAPGAGSIFTIELPCGSPRAEVLNSQQPRRNGARRVLLAEDQIVNQRVATLLLQRMGLEVTVVGDGEQAVHAWRDGSYDVLLLDVQMPVMDGLEAARAVRRGEREGGRPRIPIAALTANALAADRIACREAGMDEVLAKPITREAIAALLASLVPVR